MDDGLERVRDDAERSALARKGHAVSFKAMLFGVVLTGLAMASAFVLPAL